MQITWFEWSEAAFAQARAARKPILLSITAAWCHWCQVMDATCYADPAIAALVIERFVPVRVDSDRRPDINERYNLGGWPTTAFLTPSGDVLGGTTFVSRERMVKLLEQVAAAFETRREDLDARASTTELWGAPSGGPESWRPASAGPEDSATGGPEEEIDRVSNLILAEFDAAHGGFGGEPKFPHAPALMLALGRYRDTNDEQFAQIVTFTLDAMGDGPLYDAVEGGFFRYSTTRDWSLPHSEKLLDVNADLLMVCLEAWQTFDRETYHAKVVDIIRYVQGTLADAPEGGFFASQAGDRAYYTAGTMAQRAGRRPPLVDRTLYCDVNGLMARAYLAAGEVLGEPALSEFAIQSLDRLLVLTYRPGEGVAHYHDPDREVRGLLGDQIRMAAALVDAHLASGRAVYLDLAQELVLYATRTLWDERAGGFADRAAEPDAIGLLRTPLTPFVLNCEAARLLARLAAVTEDESFRARAMRTLDAIRPAARSQGLLAASYALAVRDVELG